MSNYATGNPPPSIDPRDLDDNATVFDQLMNSTTTSVPDRLGVPRKTWHQVEIDAQALVSPNVSALAGLTGAANTGFYFTGAGSMATYTLSSVGRNVAGAVDKPAGRAAIDAIALTDTGAYAGSAAKLGTARSIASTGDVAWSVSFDGSAGASGAATLAATGITAGTYQGITFDAKGRATAATSQLGTFTSLTLQNSWAVNSGGRAAYRKFFDMVYLEIQINGGTATDGTVFATLPAGFRPPFQVTVAVVSGPTATPSSTVSTSRVIINTDGTMQCQNCSSTSGIRFTAFISTI